MQAIADEPAYRDIHLRFSHQPAVMDDAEQKARKHQPDSHLGIDAGPPVVGTVKAVNLTAQPAQIENVINAGKNVIIGHKFSLAGEIALGPIRAVIQAQAVPQAAARNNVLPSRIPEPIAVTGAACRALSGILQRPDLLLVE